MLRPKDMLQSIRKIFDSVELFQTILWLSCVGSQYTTQRQTYIKMPNE